ncbi:hypothetical protein AO265_00185 [Pseudomonas sp. ABAC61]|nr:hypothetical protein AO265_00185 [Pseudomonas sp. ABAC61]
MISVFGELVAQDCTLGHQLAIVGVAADAGAQLQVDGLGVGAHLCSMGSLDAQVVDQLLALNGITLVENVLVDFPGSADAAVRRNLLQHLAQFELLQRCSLGTQGQGQQKGDGRNGKAQHETLLVQ